MSKIDKNIKQTAHRVYDAPNKGILWGWEVAGYIFTKAIAAGILAFPFLFQLTGLVKIADSVFIYSGYLITLISWVDRDFADQRFRSA